MGHKYTHQMDALVAGCHHAAESELVRYSSGNMSCRLPDGLMAVTAKGSWLGRISRHEIAVCRIEDGAAVSDGLPSVESGFHRGIYQARPDVHVVLHCQSPCATAVACGRPESLAFDIIPEAPFYCGTPAVVEYGNPGSPELAVAVVEAARDHAFILLRNHGQVALGATFDDVIQKAGFFELTCEILLHGKDIRPIPAEGVDALRARAIGEHARRTV